MQFPLAVGTLGLAAGLLLVLAVLALRRRGKPGAPSVALFAGAGVVWTVTALAGVLAPTLDVAVLAARLAYLGIPLTSIGLFTFVLVYTGRSRYLTRPVLGVLALEAVAINVLVWTNGRHGWVWTDVQPGGVYGFEAALGPGFYAHAIFSYALVTIALGLLLYELGEVDSIYRKQVAAVFTAALVPIASNAAYLLEATRIDYTPAAFALTVGVFFVAMFRYDLIDVTPVAREAVIDALDSGVLVVDADGRILDANPTQRELLGSDRDPIGERIEAIVDGTDLADVYTRREPGTAAVTVDRPAGSRHLAVDSRPVDEAPGHAAPMVHLTTDVTERRRRERELERQNERLDRFAAVVSHDLRNPLGIAAGYVDFARESGDLDRLEPAADALGRMEELVEDVLTMVRHGGEVTDPEPVDFAALAPRAWGTVDTGDARLAVEEPGTVLGDETALTRAFENLFRNAVEHNPDPTEPITVTVAATTDGVIVEDDGVGIPADRRESVLEAGETTTERGTGFGLSIVAEIAEAHGWALSVEESAAGGARFVFTGVDRPREPSVVPGVAAE